MKLTVLEQYGKGLVQCEAALGEEIREKIARLKWSQTRIRLKCLFQNRLGRLGRNFLDVHSTRSRRHKNRFGLQAIEHDAQVQFSFNGERFLDEQSLYNPAFRPRLMSHQRHAQHLFCDLGGFGRIARDLDTAAFSPAARVNLRFHHHAAAQRFGCRLSFRRRCSHMSARHRYIEFGQDSLGLVFVNFHGSVCIPTSLTCQDVGKSYYNMTLLPFLHQVAERRDLALSTTTYL